MLKTRYFIEKLQKSLSTGGSAPRPPLPLTYIEKFWLRHWYETFRTTIFFHSDFFELVLFWLCY